MSVLGNAIMINMSKKNLLLLSIKSNTEDPKSHINFLMKPMLRVI